MRLALKIFGGLVGVTVLVAAILAAMNWTLIQNLRTLRTATVLDVDMFQPRRVVNGCDQGPLPTYGANSPLPQSVFDAMKAYSDSEGAVGFMVLVDGKVVGETYRDGADEDTRTLSYSMHKSVMGLAYGAAVADGIIGSIDDPVGQYITEWENDPRGKTPIRAFLNMSSGLENPGFTDLRALKVNFSDDVTKTVLSLPQIHEPFEVFHYKGPDSQVAGVALKRAIEAAGNASYAAYLSEKIWCPIGAKDALLWPENETGDPRFYAYLDASLSDWARVGLMIGNDGQFNGKTVLPASWIDTIKVPSSTNPNYGLQTWIGSPYTPMRTYAPEGGVGVTHSAPYLADDVIFFDGFGGQRVYVVPSANLVIARSGDVSFTFDDAILVNLALEGLGYGGS